MCGVLLISIRRGYTLPSGPALAQNEPPVHEFAEREVVPAYDPIPTTWSDAMRHIFIRRFVFGDDYVDFLLERLETLQDQHADNHIAQRVLDTLDEHLRRHRGHHHAAIMVPQATHRFSPQEFYFYYKPYITSPNAWLPDRCFTYFDEIDALARAEDVPTSLIIATWFKESSCAMRNPSNRNGLFQIISYDYGTDEVTLEELLVQIQDFIAFSRNKRDWYLRLQMFDDLPVDLRYDSWSLQDVRKQALLYNGLYPGLTLENSWYPNNNFGGFHLPRRSQQDGLVVMMLQALAYEYDYEAVYAR